MLISGETSIYSSHVIHNKERTPLPEYVDKQYDSSGFIAWKMICVASFSGTLNKTNVWYGTGVLETQVD